jgi:N-acyl-D-amino-acid deacylase
VAQRPAGLLLSLESTANPLMFYAGFQALAGLSHAERVAKMREPEVRASILDNPPDLSKLPGPIGMVAAGWKRMFPLGDPVEYEPAEDQCLAAIAKREGREPREVAYDLLMQNEGKGIIYLPLLGYSNGSLDDIREMMMHPQSIFSLSDGGAHCGLICDASVPTYLLTHWARDRKRGERIPIEFLVHNQTQRTAEFYGLEDRGVVAAGMKADINLIDFDQLTIHAPEMVYDLPAEGRRLIQQVDGYRLTVCSGEVIFEDGQPTDARPGKLIRGPQAAPAAG